MATKNEVGDDADRPGNPVGAAAAGDGSIDRDEPKQEDEIELPEEKDQGVGEGDDVDGDGEVKEQGGDGDPDGEGDVGEEEVKELELPEEISKSVQVIRHVCRQSGLACTVYIVGTAHVSKESCDLVEAVIKFVKPKAVFIELCMERGALLREQYEVPTVKKMFEMWRSKQLNSFGVMYAYFLSKVAQRMEVLPGGEFKRAYEAGRACDALVILGDRPVSISLKRAVAKLTLWQKIKLGWNLFLSIVQLPVAHDMEKMLAELTDSDDLAKLLEDRCKDFPPLLEALLTERDLFMTATLRNTCRQFPSVVAVVGRGHVKGIVSNWEKYPIEVASLLEVPEKKSRRRGWQICLAAVGIGVGLYLGSRFSSSS